MQEYLATSLAGIHTMWNEHFGICVVEMIVGVEETCEVGGGSSDGGA